MRIFVCILFLWLSCVHATQVSIKTLTAGGKTSYLVFAGIYRQAADADVLQKKLSTLLKEPVKVEHVTQQGLYIVEVGPVNDYITAQSLQNQVQKINEVPRTAPVVPASPHVTQTQDTIKPLIQVKNSPNITAPLTSASNIWNLRNADIRAVIAEVSRVTGKNFVIDPRVQGKISIVSSTPMSNKELYQVFLSMLQVSGYAAIPTGDITKIIPALDAKSQATDRLSQMKNPPVGEDMMVEVIPIKYVPAEQLVPVLRPLMPQYSNVSAYAPSNMLILSGQANNIKQLARIISQVDSSTANGIDIIPLHHALAMDIVATLKDLVKTQTQGSANNQTTIAADDRSNSILLNGSKTERIKLHILISKLDRKNVNGDEGNTQVIYLNYLRAEDLVPILAGVAQANFTGTVGTTIGTITRPALDSTNPAASLVPTSTGQNGSPPAASTPSAPDIPNQGASASNKNEGSTKPTVQIIAEPNTNSVIINAPATLIRTLKKVINQLDIRPAQLLIEALVAEINETDFNNLGIEWGSVDQKTGAPDTFRPGFAILNSRTAIDQFEARIHALARDRRANILSTPSVVVLDNRQAKILIGKQVSIASTSYPNNANGTAASGSPYTTFDRVNVALHLYVRPQITRGRGIQLQIDQGNDTLDTANTVDPGVNATFNISSIVTSVHVESGDVVILGGLTQDSVGNEDVRVPILGDIPGIGRLFQRNATNREKKVLMVFIRPGILRNERDQLRVTGGKYNEVRQDELEFVRKEEYNVRNNDTVLQPLVSAELPRPFSHPPLNSNLATK